MTPGGFYHCLISSPSNSENICRISPTKSDVLGRVMEGVLHGYFSKRIRQIRLEDPGGGAPHSDGTQNDVRFLNACL